MNTALPTLRRPCVPTNEGALNGTSGVHGMWNSTRVSPRLEARPTRTFKTRSTATDMYVLR